VGRTALFLVAVAQPTPLHSITMDTILQHYAMLSHEEQNAFRTELGKFKSLKKPLKKAKAKVIRTPSCSFDPYEMAYSVNMLDMELGEPDY
jgi:hypothetical protein